MYCPKCGFTTIKNTECPRCGVILGKVKKRQTGTQSKPFRHFNIIICAALLGIGSALCVRLYPDIAGSLTSNISRVNWEKLPIQKLLEESKRERSLEFEDLLKSGIKSFQKRNYEEAEQSFLKITEKSPYDPVALELLGNIYSLKGEYDIAEEYFNRAIQESLAPERIRKSLQKLKKEASLQSRMVQEKRSYFNLHFEGGEENPVLGENIIGLMDSLSIKICEDFNTELKGSVEVILLSREDYRNVTESRSWSGGLYDGKIRIPVKNLNGNFEKLKPVLAHELTHMVIHTKVGTSCPIWLNEGLACYQEGRSKYSISIARKYLSGNSTFKLGNLPKSFLNLSKREAKNSYALSNSIVNFLIERYGMSSMQDVLQALSEGKTAEEAIQDVYMLNINTELTAEFKSWINNVA